MKQSASISIYSCLLASLLVPHCLAKPGGDYSTLPGDYGSNGPDIISGYQQPLIQDNPALITTSTVDLKQAGSYGIPYGSPHEPFVSGIGFPYGKFGGGFGGFGGGWKPPHPIIAQYQIIAKPIAIPFSPYGWGWPSPGLFP